VPSRFKYWIGEDGLAHINKADMPNPVTVEHYMTEGPMPKIKFRMAANPLFAELEAEIKAVTGFDRIIIEEKGDS
jgi:hypothetical protein